MQQKKNTHKVDSKDENNCLVKTVHLNRVKKARDNAPPKKELEKLSNTFKALGDPTRLKIVMALSDEEMCVCDIAAYTGVSDSAVSHQLRRLKDLSIVKNRRAGQILYYSLDDNHITDIITIGHTHIKENK